MIYNIIDCNPILCARAHSDPNVVSSIYFISSDLSNINRQFHTRQRYRVMQVSSTPMGAPPHMHNSIAYTWAVDLLIGLHVEYKLRYKKNHKLENLSKILQCIPRYVKNDIDKTELYKKAVSHFRVYLPQDYRCPDLILSNRLYYKSTARLIYKRGREEPWWFDQKYLDKFERFKV